ncbi:MAG: HlyD family efflux transporter periplasmic adaptor subunit [Pseudomonadota bacterium]
MTAAAALPPLREDLGLMPGPEDRYGTPSWTIHDPARNRYFRIGREAFELLARWHLGDPARVLARVHAEAGLALDSGDVEAMAGFLDANHLIRRDDPGGPGRLAQSAAAGRRSWAAWLVHNYLFFRLPLVRPDRVLAATLPWVRPFYGRAALAALTAAWGLGLLLALRQWDVFAATLPQFFTWQGAAWFAGALAAAKLVHELGHAYTARRFGCRVPTMGVAFMVLVPMLYTDTSDTWRLASRRQRLAVAGAGVAAEAMLGGIALLAWSFLPDGPARSAAFSLATVVMVGTLAINLSPFMRFDGYYLLSDALGVENLQDRAFALARWRLRKGLLGLDEPEPERFPPRLRATLLAYAYATWVYRLMLFLGIAVVVYHLFFKLLGIVLFAVEIMWFVGNPILRETREWWRRRAGADRGRLAMTGAGLGLALLLLAVPWRAAIDLPAVARAGSYSAVYPPVAARVLAVDFHLGDAVTPDTVLATLWSPELDHALASVEVRLARQRALLLREVASPEAGQAIHVLRRQLVALESERDGLLDERRRLSVKAPVAGTVVEASPILRPGLWVGRDIPLAYVADRARPEITAFLAEEDLARLAVGAEARFVPDDPALASHPCVVRSISDVNVPELDFPMLSSLHGGPLAVREDADRRAVPTKGLYRVELDFTGPPPLLDKAARGLVVAEGERRSLLGRAFDVVAAVLIRESGF